MEDDTWVRIEAFAREEFGKPLFGGRLTLTPATRLEEDVQITGIDAIEFIDKWLTTFGIAVTEFPYNRYFGPESSDLLGALLGIFAKRFRPSPLVPITLGMLAEATRLGRWDTDEIEAWARDAN
ncbi:DUF1493 family protein [Trinickia mobilis]|uniref:DUF1493 family protein n=1 Tax=Trinickia mobilis TaxID=2816356 RepID=UPI001A8CD52D|nr:DUF1493 family protein [Trinickia mobilis]